MTFADNLETERFPHETVSFSVFTEEIKNIWTEIKTIREKLVEPHQLKENEKERKIIRKFAPFNKRIKIEERDSYRTAIQIMTKEINAHKEKINFITTCLF